MKKVFKWGLGLWLSALCVLTLPGCGGKTDPNKLYIYNWTYYTPGSIIEKFEKEYGVTVIYDEFASNEDMYAKLRAGGAGYDIVFPSGDYTSIMIHQNMLEKIDKSRVPNLGNIDPAVLQRAAYDQTMDYSVPYYFGAAGIAVNTARVPNFERSWSIFGRSDLKDRMTMLDDMREVLGDALTYLGYSVNTKNSAEIEEAKNLVNNSWKPNLVKFDAEAFGKGYADGDFWVVQGYAEVVYEEIAENEQLMRDTVFFIPPEGGPAYIDSMCILKGSKHIIQAVDMIRMGMGQEDSVQLFNSCPYCLEAEFRPGVDKGLFPPVPFNVEGSPHPLVPRIFGTAYGAIAAYYRNAVGSTGTKDGQLHWKQYDGKHRKI